MTLKNFRGGVLSSIPAQRVLGLECGTELLSSTLSKVVLGKR